MTIARLEKVPPGGDYFIDTEGWGTVKGVLLRVPFPSVASIGVVAITAIQSKLFIAGAHRVRGVVFAMDSATVITPGADPAFDVYRHLPVAGACSAALESPAIAGSVTAGVHKYAIAFYDAVGISTPGPTVSVTVADAAVNGKVRLTNIPLGPTGTVGRKIYRTLQGGTTLTLCDTIADNTTTFYLDNIADGALSGVVPVANASGGASILAATVKGSDTGLRILADQPLSGALASGVDQAVMSDTMYTVRAFTGASTGAAANLHAHLLVEFVSTL